MSNYPDGMTISDWAHINGPEIVTVEFPCAECDRDSFEVDVQDGYAYWQCEYCDHDNEFLMPDPRE